MSVYKISEVLRLAIEAQKAGDSNKAKFYYLAILRSKPNHPFVNNNLGLLALKEGNPSKAINFFQNALEDKPQIDEVWMNLGIAQKNNGELEEAIKSYQRAIEINPEYAFAYYNIGIAQKNIGELEEAIKNYKRAIEIKPDFDLAFYNLGNAYREKGYFEEAIDSFRKAIEIKPDFTLAKINLDNIYNKVVPAWHITMMNDSIRNKKYIEAIRNVMKTNKKVLEIGTGSGLLSMAAIDAGAENVITCESSKIIAKIAEKIIKKNNYQNKIKVINKRSTDLLVGRDLPEKVDIIISEVLSAEFVGEGVLSTIFDANNRILKDDGIMIPERGEIRIALIGNCKEVMKKGFVGKVSGYDLSEFNSVIGKKLNSHLREKPLLLSQINIPFEIDFYNKTKIVIEEKVISIKVINSGICLGLIQWLRISLFENIVYENKPGEIDSHWPTPIYLLNNPIEVKSGQIIKIKATLLEDKIWFEFLEVI